MSVPHGLRIFVAGILALPALLLLVAVSPFILLLSVPSLAILVRRKRTFLHPPSSPRRADGEASAPPLLRHALITGGSSGIGLAVARELATRGCAHVTLVARKEDQLAAARAAVQATARAARTITVVRVASVDVADFSAVEEAARRLCGDGESGDVAPGPPTLLFHCAGYSRPLAFDDLSAADFRAQVEVNYLGSVHVVKAFLPHMSRPGHAGGNVVLTSSMTGQVGTFGYAAYSPTKFALRGFAECLSMELAAKAAPRVNVSLAYPPDTQTPGYELENRSKPEECRLISETSGVWDPAIVGKKMVESAVQPQPPFDIYFGLDGWMLATLTAGMSPVTGVADAVCQVALMGLLRLVSLFYLLDFGRITQNYRRPGATVKED